MLSGLKKYRLVYTHLWATYGASWKVRISFLLQIVGRVCKLVMLPIALSLIITRLSEQDYPGAHQAVYLFVVFSFILGVLAPFIKHIGMRGENLAYSKVVEQYFSRLIHADLEYFHSNLAGYLTSATRQYADSCIQLVRAWRDAYLNTVLSILLPLFVILWVDWAVGLVALGLSALQVMYMLWAANVIGPLRTESRELYKRHSGETADAISNILAIRSAAREDMYVEHARANAVKEVETFGRRYAIQARLIAARELISVFFFMVLLWLVVERMDTGNIALTGAVLIVSYTATILTAVYALSENLEEHDDLVDKIIPSFDILHRKNRITDPATPVAFTQVRGEIHLQGVSFSYHQDRDDLKVLNDFSLHIPSGQKIGVVGLSGAGKSSLTKLLLRFTDVDAGSIQVDGIDIRDITQADLRRNIAYVPQEPMLFHASIRDNVLVAHPEATDAEVTEALRKAHALEFVRRLPDGVDSIVGERGVKLSGGQKQRIAIARAVLQRAPIMILDEATSALDSESEEMIKRSFGEILQDKTAMVVAHRLSTLSDMHRIIVIEDGRLVEDGTHRALLAKKGIYAGMWKRQQNGEEV